MLLHSANTVHEPCNTLQRMLGRDIISAVVGTVHMGIHIGIANGDIQHIDPKLIAENIHKPESLRKIRGDALVFLHAEAVGIGEAVVHIQTAGDDKFTAHRSLCRRDAVSQQSCAVFKASAVLPFTGIGREELAEQIPVAALYIHAVKADLLRHGSCPAEPLFQSAKLPVGNDAGGIDGLILFKQRIIIGNDRFGIAVGVCVSAGMGGLHDELRGKAVLFHARLPDIFKHSLEGIQIPLLQAELIRFSPGFLQNGNGLHPDEGSTALGKAAVTAACKLSGNAVICRIAAFHRLDHKAVFQLDAGFLRFGKKAAYILRSRDLRPHLRRTLQHIIQ